MKLAGSRRNATLRECDLLAAVPSFFCRRIEGRTKPRCTHLMYGGPALTDDTGLSPSAENGSLRGKMT